MYKHVVDVTQLENYWLVKQRDLLFRWVTNVDNKEKLFYALILPIA